MHLSSCLQLAAAADSPQGVIQEVNWLRCSCAIQPLQFRQTNFYDRRCFCCKARNFSLLIVFLLVMIVFHYFQTNSVNKRNKGYSTLVVWGNCFRSLPNLIRFLNFSRTWNNLSLVRSTVMGVGGEMVRATLFQKKVSFPSPKSNFCTSPQFDSPLPAVELGLLLLYRYTSTKRESITFCSFLI